MKVSLRENGDLLFINDMDEVFSKENISKDTWDNLKHKYSEPIDFFEVVALRTCNLKCPSCRKKFHTKPNNDLIDKLCEEMYKIALDSKLIGLVDGEFFFQEKIMDVIRKIPKESTIETIYIRSNGILFTKDLWESFSNIHDKEITFFISIDATDKETYEYNRFPAKWEIINEKIQQISSLCKDNDRYNLRLCFTIQYNNFKQLPDFIKLCEKLEAVPHLNYIGNWGTYEENEFEKVAVHHIGHDYNKEFREILKQCDIDPFAIIACDGSDLINHISKYASLD